MSQHNLVYGENGSGKTSLLEAAHILGTARSFRSGSAKSQITHGESSYVIRGEVISDAHGGGTRAIGVQRQRNGELALRVAGAKAQSVAQLADEVPLLLINADSFDLLVGPPVNRRRFLDWGLFHVEHPARDSRRRFQRSLEQRNHLLRRGKLHTDELAAWDHDLSEQGEVVSAARERFLSALRTVFDSVMQVLAPEIGDVSLVYRRGWDANLSYAQSLERSLSSDQEQGFTQSGPQRADIRVTVEGYSAAETLSRGQQKLLVCALKLAQGQILSERTRSNVLYLIDDLPSELDDVRCERVCRLLGDMSVQTVVTSVSRDAVPQQWFRDPAGIGMFHVKHGQVESQQTAS